MNSLNSNPIRIVAGKGTGTTSLSAFDAALVDAGTAGANIIVLSSVIPAGSQVKIEPYKLKKENIGDLLFVVQAVAKTKEKETIAAGLGWIQTSNDSGIFVEHTGKSEAEVQELLEISLRECAKRRDIAYDPHMRIVSATGTGKPTCALVQALYMLQDSRTGQRKEF